MGATATESRSAGPRNRRRRRRRQLVGILAVAAVPLLVGAALRGQWMVVIILLVSGSALLTAYRPL